MSSEYKNVSLGELADIKHGWACKSDFFSDLPKENPVVVGIGNFRYEGGFRFESTKLKYYEGEFPNEYLLDAGEILLVMTCQTAGGEILGIPGRIPSDNRRYLHNQRLGKFVNKRRDVFDNDYAYNLFKTADFNRFLASSATGTKILHTSPDRILQYSFELPPIHEQKAIANILGTLDDKIELNRKTNETLEAMAKALFKSWFVDFDPVRAKAEGRPTGLPAEISDLFPDSFEDSELGEIPKGWEVGGLEKFLVLQRGFDLPAPHRIKGAYPVVAASGVSGTHNEPMASAPGVVTGRSGVLGKVFYIQTDFFPLNTTLWAKEFRLATPIYGYFLLSDIDFAIFNAGSAVPTLNRNHLGTLRFPLPPKAIVVSFTEVAAKLMKRKEGIVAETSNLATTRDALLPKLISGEIRIPDAEKILEEVGI
jgi:type I restriction enzyme, S subunit